MRLNNILLLALISLFFSANIYGQYLIVTDPDGYTNVREKPNANSKILKTFSDLDAIQRLGYFPEDDDIAIIESQNWLPVYLNDSTDNIAYVYHSNVEEIYDLPRLNFRVQDSLNMQFFDAEMKLSIQLQNIAKSKYIKKETDPETQYTRFFLRGGAIHYPYFIGERSYAIAKVSIEYQNIQHEVDSSLFYNLFLTNNPLRDLCSKAIYNSYREDIYVNFNLFKGKQNLYYLYIHLGDGGDAYTVLWIINNGEVIKKEGL